VFLDKTKNKIMEFKHPFTCIVAGPTSSGKTVFVNKLLEARDEGEELFDTTFTEIIWCYSESASVNAHERPGITFIEGLPDESMFDGEPKLLILDDLMHDSSEKVAKLFTKVSHHRNVSVIFITQNLFHQNKHARDMALNSHYLVVFKNPRDKSQIMYLARQLFPENPKFVQDAYIQATSKPHGYLVIDLKQDTEDNLRIKSDIFDPFVSVYVQK
jgi:hypothetical protein